MTLYQDVQAKAQAEIDSFLGGNRLPEMEDRECLPYINNIVKEVYRWRSIVPLGIAVFPILFYSSNFWTNRLQVFLMHLPKRMCIRDIVFLKGLWCELFDTVIFPNLYWWFNASIANTWWACSNSTQLIIWIHAQFKGYEQWSSPVPQPRRVQPRSILWSINPGRSNVWLWKKVRIPLPWLIRSIGLMNSSRSCPGIHLAHANLFITIATVLTIFDIRPVYNTDGTPRLPKGDMILNSAIRYAFYYVRFSWYSTWETLLVARFHLSVRSLRGQINIASSYKNGRSREGCEGLYTLSVRLEAMLANVWNAHCNQ